MVTRTVDKAAHARRRGAFLDAAQRLVQTKGYEEMSVQDLLDETGSSKGAFYHYFTSKQDLLRASVERMAEAVAAHLRPVADGPDPAADKLRRFFAAPAGWKTQHRDLLIALVRVWQSDANALVRQRLRAETTARICPLLAEIVAQGDREGAFSVLDPEQAARVLMALIHDLGDRLADLLLAPGGIDLPEVERTITAYTDAVERVLGLGHGSIALVDRASIRAWFGSEQSPTGNR